MIERFSALAMVIDTSPLGGMMASVYLHIAQSGIPTQLFPNEELAKDWLSGQRPSS